VDGCELSRQMKREAHGARRKCPWGALAVRRSHGYFFDGKLVGAIAFVLSEGLLDITRLVVHPDFFQRGIGKELVQHVFNEYRNMKKYIVRTGAKNVPAKNLYKKLGFDKIEDIEVAPGVYLTRFEKRNSNKNTSFLAGKRLPSSEKRVAGSSQSFSAFLVQYP
jgi:ribosomal protein S18 acetylase RimI-like enzyme